MLRARSRLQLRLCDASDIFETKLGFQLSKFSTMFLFHFRHVLLVDPGKSPPAATPGSGPAAAAAKADANAAEAPPAEVQAAYVAQYMATVARLAAARGGAGDQKKPNAGGTACLSSLNSHVILHYIQLSHPPLLFNLALDLFYNILLDLPIGRSAGWSCIFLVLLGSAAALIIVMVFSLRSQQVYLHHH